MIFLWYSTSENTFDMLRAGDIIADEIKLYRDLTEDYINNNVSDIPPAQDDTVEGNNETPPEEDVEEYPSRISKLTTPVQVIRYLNNQINRHKNQFSNRLDSLIREVDKLNSQLDLERMDALVATIDYINSTSEQFQNLMTDLEALNNRPDSDIDTNLQDLINQSNALLANTNFFINHLETETDIGGFSLKGPFNQNKLPSRQTFLRSEGGEKNPFRKEIYKV